MGGKRQARLNEQFRREITGILRTEVRDPRVGIPTVTGVEVTPDLWMARVHVRPDPTLEGDEARDALLEGLEAAAPFIRRALGKTLTMRRVPELRFQVDRSIEHAARIHALLAEALHDGGGEDEDADGIEGEMAGEGNAETEGVEGGEGTMEEGEAAGEDARS
jgi:ribosome-binding factor A